MNEYQNIYCKRFLITIYIIYMYIIYMYLIYILSCSIVFNEIENRIEIK